RMRSTSCQISSYCWRIMGMTICLAPRGACGGGVFRSRFTCRVFGRASILASPSLERRRMTKMPPDGYPALQYLHSVRVSNFQHSRRRPIDKKFVVHARMKQASLWNGPRGCSVSKDGDREPAAMRSGPVFPEKEALPGSQFAASILDRQGD